MTDFKKSLALVLITILVTVICMRYLSGTTPQANVAQVKQNVQVGKAKEQTIDKSYKAALDRLQKQNDSLKNVIAVHKEALRTADSKVAVLEQKVSHLADKVKQEPDTVKVKVSDCDSLSKETTALVQKEDEKDSLCNETITALTAQVNEKESALGDCEGSYLNMKLALDTSLQQQQQLSNELNAMNKHLKRKALQSKLLSAGVMVLTGITTTLLLTQKH